MMPSFFDFIGLGSCCCGFPSWTQVRRRCLINNGCVDQSRSSEWPVPAALKSSMLNAGPEGAERRVTRSARSRRSFSVSFAACEVTSIHELPEEDRRGTFVPDEVKAAGSGESVAASTRIVITDVMEDFVPKVAPSDVSARKQDTEHLEKDTEVAQMSVPDLTHRHTRTTAGPAACHDYAAEAVHKETRCGLGLQVVQVQDAMPAPLRKFTHLRVRTCHVRGGAPESAVAVEKAVEEPRCGLGLEVVHMQQAEPTAVRKFTHSRARTVCVRHGA
eukprot:TRINITY_DN5911_c0_g1_i1.p1 TRINITY_DN5911_c0_g1~~TRINITY_DN5911_c0_g1_i1.p1  ORF type:complete len:274 (+),score=39.13 TRINITY_DN5911_c0_g1_i1:45-866(+)